MILEYKYIMYCTCFVPSQNESRVQYITFKGVGIVRTIHFLSFRMINITLNNEDFVTKYNISPIFNIVRNRNFSAFKCCFY